MTLDDLGWSLIRFMHYYCVLRTLPRKSNENRTPVSGDIRFVWIFVGVNLWRLGGKGQWCGENGSVQCIRSFNLRNLQG